MIVFILLCLLAALIWLGHYSTVAAAIASAITGLVWWAGIFLPANLADGLLGICFCLIITLIAHFDFKGKVE